jgi:hypothetical protein
MATVGNPIPMIPFTVPASAKMKVIVRTVTAEASISGG